VCGLYDVDPSKLGQVTNLVTRADHYGKQKQVNNFITINLNTRFKRNMRLGGGIDTGRTVTDNCFVIDSPQQRLNCHVVTPFKGQTQIKANGSFPLPAGFIVSGVYQNLSGLNYTAAYTAPTRRLPRPWGGISPPASMAPCPRFHWSYHRHSSKAGERSWISGCRISSRWASSPG